MGQISTAQSRQRRTPLASSNLAVSAVLSSCTIISTIISTRSTPMALLRWKDGVYMRMVDHIRGAYRKMVCLRHSKT